MCIINIYISAFASTVNKWNKKIGMRVTVFFDGHRNELLLASSETP